MTHMKSIPLFGVVNLPEMEQKALEVLRSGRIASGEYVAQFEAGLGELIDAENVVSTVDMSSALVLALHLAGVRYGDEVITTAFACMSTNSAIANCGATPVWVDVKPQSVEMDPSDLEQKLTPQTKAVVLYHVAGYPGPAKEISALCKRHGITLIEDCDNALFAHQAGIPVGSYGDFAIYSFYPNRQINTTEGGALICKDSDMAARARKLRRFGIDAKNFRDLNGEINPSSDIPEIGWGYTMNNLCAAMGTAQLTTAAQRVAKAQQNVALLTEKIGALHDLERHVSLMPIPHDAVPAYWVLLLWVKHRDEVLKSMKLQGVSVSTLHQRNDVYTGFHADTTALPNTTDLQNHVLAVPCGWWLSQQDLDYIVTSLQNAHAPYLS
ncbi:MAG: DegT/DnrJ/EryC1/StrS family aminotransferase [Aquirhabdus sp.]